MFYWNKAMSFVYCLWLLLSYNGRAEWLWRRPYDQQRQKYLLSGLLRNSLLPGMVACTCNPSTLGGQGERLLKARSSKPAWVTRAKFHLKKKKIAPLHSSLVIKGDTILKKKIAKCGPSYLAAWEAEMWGSPEPREIEAAVSYDGATVPQPGRLCLKKIFQKVSFGAGHSWSQNFGRLRRVDLEVRNSRPV